MKVLILWVDALRHDYIKPETMPFLHSLKARYGLNFCEGMLGYGSIFSTFITGKYPEETNQFSSFILNQQRSFLDKVFYQIVRVVPNPYSFYLINLLNFALGKDFFTPAVDLKVLKEFKQSPEKFYHKRSALAVKTLFNYLDDNSKIYIGYNWPLVFSSREKSRLTPFVRNRDLSRASYFKSLLKRSEADLYFMHLWDLDYFGHLYGPDVTLLQEKLIEQDKHIRSIVSDFSWEEDLIIIWSDHGLIEVKNKVNLLEFLPKSEKYKVFLDSTMARFYLEDRGIEQEIMGALKDKSFGYFVSDDIKEKYHLNFKDNRFGDLIYAVHEGSLIYPNHFQGFNEVKAMHGYGQNLDGEKSVYISNAGKIGAGRLIDFTPFILDRMGLNFL